jgi:O-antigen ligase
MKAVSYTISGDAYAIGAALDRVAFGCLCAFVFAVPWEESIPLLDGFVIGRWIGLLTIAVLALRVAVTDQFRRPSPLHGLMAAFMAWAALSLIWTIDRENTLIRASTYIQLLAVVWMIWELVVAERRVPPLLLSYVMGSSLLGVSTIVNYAMGKQAADLWAEAGQTKWHDFRYSAYGVNENDLGLMLALSVPMTIYMLTRKKGPLITVFCWLHMGLCFTTILLCGSRGGLFAAIIGLGLFPMVMSRLPRWQRLAFVAACAAGLAIGIYLVPEEAWSRFRTVGTEITEGTLTHRTVLWSAGLEAFRDHAFAGVGAGAYGAAVLRAVDIPLVAHNTFLSVLVELGVTGALLLLALLAALYYAAARMRYLEKRFWLVLLTVWVVGVCALTWEYNKPTWLLFGLLAAHFYAHKFRSDIVYFGVADHRLSWSPASKTAGRRHKSIVCRTDTL